MVNYELYFLYPERKIIFPGFVSGNMVTFFTVDILTTCSIQFVNGLNLLEMVYIGSLRFSLFICSLLGNI